MNTAQRTVLMLSPLVLASGCVSLPFGSTSEWRTEDTSHSFVAAGKEYHSSQCTGAVKNDTCFGAIIDISGETVAASP